MDTPLKKILFVDDDLDILTIARYAFKLNSQVELRCVNSGDKAIAEARQFLPDLILLDVMMPKMDGVSTMKILRQTPGIEKIPVILCTAKVTKEEISFYQSLGILNVITKPFNPLTLAQTIEKMWQEHQSNSL